MRKRPVSSGHHRPEKWCFVCWIRFWSERLKPSTKIQLKENIIHYLNKNDTEMEELKHISPEFDWGDGTDLGNDIVYCASSTGLNSPVLFHHFLQLSIRSSTNCSILLTRIDSNSIVLASNSSFEDISTISKRNASLFHNDNSLGCKYSQRYSKWQTTINLYLPN